MAVTVKKIKQVRERTLCSLSDCKQAPPQGDGIVA